MGDSKYPFATKTEIELNPKRLLLFGKTKIGKSTILSGLDECLILEFEKEGSEYLTGNVVQINNLEDLREAGKLIVASGKPYKYIAVDTITALEDMVLPFANRLYKGSPIGSKWLGNDVRTLPNGAGE